MGHDRSGDPFSRIVDDFLMILCFQQNLPYINNLYLLKMMVPSGHGGFIVCQNSYHMMLVCMCSPLS